MIEVVTNDWAKEQTSRFDMKTAVARCLWLNGMDPNRPARNDLSDNALKSLGLRQDATQTAMFARQLEYVYTQIYEIYYADLKARQLLPVDNRVPTGAEYFTYRMFEKNGSFKPIHNYADDFPEADVKASEFQQRVVGFGGSYGYSIQDMRAAAMAGVPLETEKAKACRWAAETTLDDLAAFGDFNNKLLQPDGSTAFYGFAKAPNILQATKQSPSGTWAAQIASAITGGTLAATAQAIVDDAVFMWQTGFNATYGRHTYNTLVLPTGAYSAVSSTQVQPTFNSKTILQMIKDMLEPNGLQEVAFWPRLDTAGSGSVGRAMLYEKKQETVSLIIPQEFEQFAPQLKGMKFVIPCHFRSGAVEVRYPKAVVYMDGIA